VQQGRSATARCAVGVRWEAARWWMVGVRCNPAFAKKPAGEETAGKFEYQAKVS
jgi:heat shock protein 90kDa beta